MRLKGTYQDAGTGLKTFQLVSITIISALFFALVAMLIVGDNVGEIDGLKITQFFQSIGLFVFPPLILAFIWSLNSLERLRINRLPDIKSILFAVVIMVAAVPAINLLAEINHAVRFSGSFAFLEKYFIAMDERAEYLINKVLAANSLNDLLINIGLVAIVPAVGEELFFRGTVQRLMQDKMKMHAAIWLTAFVFSSIHFQFYGFIPRLLMGALLGYLFVWTNNLWVPIIAHFTNNAMAVVFHYLKNMEKVTFDLENLGNSETYLAGIMSMLIVTLLIYLFRLRRLYSS